MAGRRIMFSELVLIGLLAVNLVSTERSVVGHDCSKLPTSIAPENCCRFPQLFKSNVLFLCAKQRETSSSDCFYDCVYELTEICRKGKCDVDKALDYVDWVWPEENPFKEPYKSAYTKCIQKANAMQDGLVSRFNRQNCDIVPATIQLCVQNEMFTSCPRTHWKEDEQECNYKRDFLSNCHQPTN